MKILFIGPVFYDYHLLIKKKLETVGAKVSFFAEKNDGLMFGVLNTINPAFIFLYQKYYYWKLWKKIKSQNFSHFFLIRGYKMPISFLKKLKENNKDIKFIMYQWDSNKNNPYFHMVEYFDETYTFDYSDFQHGKDLKFLQLFYTEEIKALRGEVNRAYKFDFFCFFSFTLTRYNDMMSFISFCEEEKHTLKYFCYIPYTTYLKFKYLKGLPLNKKYLSFLPMPKQEYLKNLGQSHIVVDFSHPTQTGLSMRVIEAYGAGKKIFTTNSSILINPIYSPNYVQLIDMDSLKMPIYAMDEVTVFNDKLFIDNWINSMFV